MGIHSVYRALIPDTGEILECITFKDVYRFALRHGKDYLKYDSCNAICTVIDLEKAWYSDYEYINKYGYPQRDIVDREHIAYLAITETGYTVETAAGCTLDVDRSAWKSVQSKKEV